MSSPKFSVIKAEAQDEIAFAIEYGRTELEWSLATNDGDIFFALAPQRCYYGMLGDEKISFIQIVSYGKKEEYCYLGMYFVKEEHRHKGYGKQTWDHAWAELPDSCLVSLSAAIPQEPLYVQSGFKTSWNELAYLFDAMKIADLPNSNVEGIKIVRYKDADFQSLLKYDTNAFCYSREVYLKKVKELSNSEGWVAIGKDGEIVGYVVARYTLEMHGWFLLPLIANNTSIAKALLVELSKFLIDQPVKLFSMSIPGINKSSLDLAEQLAEKQLFETRRMFAKGNPSDKMVENHANIIFAMSCAIG